MPASIAEDTVPLAVDQEFAEGAGLGVPRVGADRIGRSKSGSIRTWSSSARGAGPSASASFALVSVPQPAVLSCRNMYSTEGRFHAHSRTCPRRGVLGFAIAFIAFLFGGALGLPEPLRLLVIGVGVLLAVLSAGMTGFGLAALVLGGIVVVSSITLFGALGASGDLQVTPRVPTVDDTTGRQGDGGYMLTPHDKQWIEASWRRRSEAEQRAICAVLRDGVSDAELQAAARQLEEAARRGLVEGIPTEETEVHAYLRAGYAYTETEFC